MSKMLTLVALVALLVLAAPVSAQSQPKTFCFRSAPASSCRSYLLFEVRGQLPVLYTERMVETHGIQIDREGAVDEFHRSDARRMMEGTLGWDLGLALNVNENWSIGASYATEAAEWGDRSEASLHFRRWFTDQIAIEFIPGVMRLVDDRFDTPYGTPDVMLTGFNLATRIHVWEAVLGVRYDVMNVPGQITTWSGIGNDDQYTKTDPGGIEHSLSLGAAFEGLSALVLTLATLAAVASIPIS